MTNIDELIARERAALAEQIGPQAQAQPAANIDAAIAQERTALAQHMAQQPTGMAAELMRGLGLAARAVAPIGAGMAAGAAAGAPIAGVGAIPGALVGGTAAALGMPVADLATAAWNRLTGSTTPVPSQAVENLLTRAGLPEPQTGGERIIQGATRAALEAATGAGAAGRLASTLTPSSAAQGVAQTLAVAPGAQTTAATIGSATAQGARELELPEYIATPAGMVAGAAPFAMRPSVLFRGQPETALRDQNIRALQQEGVPLSPAQEIGSPAASTMESVMRYLPTSAPAVARQEDATLRAWTRSIMRRAGINSDIATPEVLRDARQAFGQEYDTLVRATKFPDVNTPVGAAWRDALFNDLADIEARNAIGFSDSVNRVYSGRKNELLDYLTGQKKLTGERYQQLQSQLAEEANRLGRSTEPGSQAGEAAFRDLRTWLANAVESAPTNPGLRDRWADVNRRYYTFSRIEDTMQMAGQDKLNTGFVPPRQFASVIQRSDPRAWVEERGDLQRIARAGAAILPDPVPNSGTAQRSFAQDILTGGKRALPAAGVGAGATAAGIPFVDPLLMLGGPYAASRLWYGRRYTPAEAGVLSGQALGGALPGIPGLLGGQ